MGNKITLETRAIGIYVFAMSLVITFVAFSYVLLFDVTGALPVTRICSFIIMVAATVGIAYSYIAASESRNQGLARIYARRDAIVIGTMTVCSVTGSTIFGMATDAMTHDIAIIQMLPEPSLIGGSIVLTVSVIAMIALDVLDRAAKKETKELAYHESGQLTNLMPTGGRGVVTSFDTENGRLQSKAVMTSVVSDPDEIVSYIPLTQMGVSRIRPNEGAIGASPRNSEDNARELQILRHERRKEQRRLRYQTAWQNLASSFVAVWSFGTTAVGSALSFATACGRNIESMLVSLGSVLHSGITATKDVLVSTTKGMTDTSRRIWGSSRDAIVRCTLSLTEFASEKASSSMTAIRKWIAVFGNVLAGIKWHVATKEVATEDVGASADDENTAESVEVSDSAEIETAGDSEDEKAMRQATEPADSSDPTDGEAGTGDDVIDDKSDAEEDTILTAPEEVGDIDDSSPIEDDDSQGMHSPANSDTDGRPDTAMADTDHKEIPDTGMSLDAVLGTLATHESEGRGAVPPFLMGYARKLTGRREEAPDTPVEIPDFLLTPRSGADVNTDHANGATGNPQLGYHS